MKKKGLRSTSSGLLELDNAAGLEADGGRRKLTEVRRVEVRLMVDHKARRQAVRVDFRLRGVRAAGDDDNIDQRPVRLRRQREEAVAIWERPVCRRYV